MSYPRREAAPRDPHCVPGIPGAPHHPGDRGHSLFTGGVGPWTGIEIAYEVAASVANRSPRGRPFTLGAIMRASQGDARANTDSACRGDGGHR